jgi:hypothetical protein
MDRRAFEKLVGYAAHPVHTEIPTANMQMTLENVEKKPLSPDLFEIPRVTKRIRSSRPTEVSSGRGPSRY